MLIVTTLNHKIPVQSNSIHTVMLIARSICIVTVTGIDKKVTFYTEYQTATRTIATHFIANLGYEDHCLTCPVTKTLACTIHESVAGCICERHRKL